MDLLDKMATYVRVLEAGSFSAAAKQLRISSAAVSRQIATLEGEVGVTLLMRSTRRMNVTPDGRLYYERCLRVLREVEEAQLVGRDDKVEGLLQITAPVTYGLERVVPEMRPLMAKHPGLRIDLRLEDRLLDLALEGVDVGIRVGSTPLQSTELVAHKISSFRRVLVASPQYLKRKGEPKTPEALAKHDTLSYVGGDISDRWSLTSSEREAHVRVNVVFRCTALRAVGELCVQGGGIALLPDWLVAEDVKRRSLKPVLASWTTEPVSVNVIHRVAHRGAPRVRALVEHLRAAVS
ncbi:MAG TPA: LysR family transcriptional regulator [Polyangiaceae bacterium]|jgi:DNA-binding transcriptional LysR family regulator|nr:LysR family transcriptional regulator [Polyangiaceae bacterium]